MLTRWTAIVEEPEGETYAALLQFAMRYARLFSLVWRDQLEFHASATAMTGILRRDLVAERRTNEWPGTQLLGHLATVRTYRMSRLAVSLLGEAGGLYSWRSPARPEDLAFYTSGGDAWLASVAHERQGFVNGRAIDVDQLTREVKGLKLGGGIASHRPR